MAERRRRVSRDDEGRIEFTYEGWHVIDGVPVRLIFAEEYDRLVCVRLEIGPDVGPESDPQQPDPLRVTTALLRKINVATLVDKTLTEAARMWRSTADSRAAGVAAARAGVPGFTIADGVTDETIAADQQQLTEFADKAAAAPKRTGRPPKYDDAHYKKVAAVYKNYSGGRSPKKAVARELGLTEPAAAKHIAEARHRGHLPEWGAG